MGDDLLRFMEEIKNSSKVLGSIKYKFIALIPKLDCPSNFDDFRLINLCNFLYCYVRKAYHVKFHFT
jgi:hypothetical protein